MTGIQEKWKLFFLFYWSYAEDYKKVTKEIDNNTKMHIELAPGGGWAAIIKKYH